jgi:hypothetical protein
VLRRKGIAAAIATFAVTCGPMCLDAGLFSKGCAEPSEESACKPEKKSCLSCLVPPPAPRARTAVGIPAVVSNQRGERAAKKDDVPPAPVAGTDTDKRVEELDRDVQIIKEQLRVLTTLLQEKK